MVEFRSSRLGNEDYVSTVDDALVALENALTAFFGIEVDTAELTPVLAGISTEGKVLGDFTFKGSYGVIFEAGDVEDGPANAPLGKIYVDTEGFLNITDVNGAVVNRIDINNGPGQSWESNDALPDYDETDNRKALMVDHDLDADITSVVWDDIDYDDIAGLPDLSSGQADFVMTLKGGDASNRYIVWDQVSGDSSDLDLPPVSAPLAGYVLQVNGTGDAISWQPAGVPAPAGAGDVGKVLTVITPGGAEDFSWQPSGASGGFPDYGASDSGKFLYLLNGSGTDPSVDHEYATPDKVKYQIGIIQFLEGGATVNLSGGGEHSLQFETTNSFNHGSPEWMSFFTDRVAITAEGTDNAFRIYGTVSFIVENPVLGNDITAGFEVALRGAGQYGNSSWVKGKASMFRPGGTSTVAIAIPINGVVIMSGAGDVKIAILCNLIEGSATVDIDGFSGSLTIDRIGSVIGS